MPNCYAADWPPLRDASLRTGGWRKWEFRLGEARFGIRGSAGSVEGLPSADRAVSGYPVRGGGAGAGTSDDGRRSAAVQAAIAYFRLGGQRHNADEEESLFPRMRATGERKNGRAGARASRAAALHARVRSCTRSGWRYGAEHGEAGRAGGDDSGSEEALHAAYRARGDGGVSAGGANAECGGDCRDGAGVQGATSVIATQPREARLAFRSGCCPSHVTCRDGRGRLRGGPAACRLRAAARSSSGW